jgi:hypothetical protein
LHDKSIAQFIKEGLTQIGEKLQSRYGGEFDGLAASESTEDKVAVKVAFYFQKLASLFRRQFC